MTSLRVVSLVFRWHDLLKIANINPQQEATLSLWKKNRFPERAADMEMGLGLHLKGALPNVRTGSHTSREIKNATISEFSTFLKTGKSREQFLLRLTFFTLFTANG